MLSDAAEIELVANFVPSAATEAERKAVEHKLREIAARVRRRQWLQDDIVSEAMDAAEAMAGATIARLVPPLAVFEGGRARG